MTSTPINFSRLSRRRALFVLGAAGATGAGLLSLTACGERALTCTDTSALTPMQRTQREGLHYVDNSPDANKNCANCNFFQAAEKENTCGACQIMPGPVSPKGNCDSWAEKQS